MQAQTSAKRRCAVILKPVPTPPLDVEGARRRLHVLLGIGQRKCERCGSTEGVELESARTAYVRACKADRCSVDILVRPCKADCPHWPKEDPNAPVLLCRPCALDHHEYWDGMWADYRAGQH
jgi:hypothetical protein